MIIPIGALLLALATPARAQVTGSSAPIFDAPTAWASFKKLLQEQYGYFDRPGVDGKAVLSAFEPRAKAARSDKEFIDILQLVSHNFADPHFIVGPFDSDDWAIIPTTSDLFGVYDGSRFRIEQVRAESDALMKGLRVGMTVLTIDGQPPRAAVEEITGRSLTALTSLQVTFALNIALAGHRRRSRTVEVIDGSRRRSFTLAPTADQAKRVQGGPLLSVEDRSASSA